MNVNAFAGTAFLVFMAAAGVMAISALPRASGGVESPRAASLVHGQWAAAFEKSLNESLPVNDFSRAFWGNAEFDLFHQGRQGAVVGRDGWLYSDEEYACPRRMNKNIADNFAFIENTKNLLASQNVRLIVVAVPAKARIVPEYLPQALPACRENIFSALQDFLKASDIPAADLAAPMLRSPLRTRYYLRTDTHWTPAGAQFAAREVKALLQQKMPALAWPALAYAVTEKAAITHEGDLMRYVPGVGAARIVPDRISPFATESAAKDDSGDNLLGEAPAPPVTLVGTSYSANPKWNFEGFLKHELSTDILNAADEGLGPFTVMDKYLASPEWKNRKPQLVIWEMPERFLPYPHGVTGNK